jgi:cytochrome oxidase Cu insertion factor (SCO1/SenC/PrrC family)
MASRTLLLRGFLGAALAGSLGTASFFYMCPHRPGSGDAPSSSRSVEEASCCANDEAAPVTDPPTTAQDLPSSDVVDQSRPLAIPDAPLLDQYGRPVRFYTDLVRGRVVAINFIFTTCQGVCPPMGATFGKLLKDLQGQGVRLISVSVDPVNDTPERLAAWSAKFGAGPDWTLVTGDKQDVDGLLRALVQFQV